MVSGVYIVVLHCAGVDPIEFARPRGGCGRCGAVDRGIGDRPNSRLRNAAGGVANFLCRLAHPGRDRRGHARRLIVTSAALVFAAIAFSIQLVPAWPASMRCPLVVTGEEVMSNVSPPTLLLALHRTWMSLVFVAAAEPIRRWAGGQRVWHVVAVGNSGAMTPTSGTFRLSQLPLCLCMPSASTPSTSPPRGSGVFSRPGGGLRTGYGDCVCRAFTAGASAVALVDGPV